VAAAIRRSILVSFDVNTQESRATLHNKGTYHHPSNCVRGTARIQHRQQR
jgi:hypothetical protein